MTIPDSLVTAAAESEGVVTERADLSGVGRNDTSGPNTNVGPLLERPKPRCGHCGRWIPRSVDEFGDHLDGPCPVGGTFVNGKVKHRKTAQSDESGAS